jgi:hypothetical protein
VYQESGQIWSLASINLEGKDFKEHYSGVFMADSNSKRYEIRNKCTYAYFEDKSCYYNDGKIVLTDCVKLIEYNISNGEVREFDATEYTHPKCPYDAEISNKSSISISTQTDTRLLTFAEAASLSEEFQKLMEFDDCKTWDGKSALAMLFDSVIYDGSNIYLVCRVLNYSGETHVVVFCYQFDSNELCYCFNYFNNGVINNGFYIVP